MQCFLLLQDGAGQQGQAPLATLWTYQWNLDDCSADDEKYERKTQYASTHQDPNQTQTKSHMLCMFRDDHKSTLAEIEYSTLGAPALRFKHNQKGYCQLFCRMKILVITLPKSGSGWEVVLSTIVNFLQVMTLQSQGSVNESGLNITRLLLISSNTLWWASITLCTLLNETAEALKLVKTS